MILRKPYAFFIKYFKLIHLVMAVLMMILVGQTNSFLTFFNQYINSSTIVIGRDLVSELFFNFTYLYIIFVLVMDVIIWILLDFKGKRKIFYVLTFLSYVLLLTLYLYIRSVFVSMGEEIVDVRLVMVLRDFTIIAFVIQVLTLFITITRAIGLNLKQFDFESDLKELNIASSDNEEFEINVDLDSQKVKRTIKTVLRNYKYYLKENLRIVIPIVLVTVAVIIFFVYQNMYGSVTRYKEGQVFNVANYSLKVEDTFVTNKNFQLSKISEEKSLVVVKTGIKSSDKNAQFMFGSFALQIGDSKYYHTVQYSNALKDLGATYIKQKLTNDYVQYLLVYEIPNSLIDKEMKIVYVKEFATGLLGRDERIEIKLEPINLDLVQKQSYLKLNQPITIENFLLDGSNFILKEVLIDNIFKINYQYSGYIFYEPLQASFYGSYDKALIKINLELSNISPSVKDASKFISMYGVLDYEINGFNKSFNLKNEKKPYHAQPNVYYYEIPKEVLSAKKITLKIQLRGNNYVYTIK